VDVFGVFRRADPSLALKQALEAQSDRLSQLERAFAVYKLDWETVVAKIDQLAKKVHRELGHVTKRQALESPSPDESKLSIEPRRGRFRGGRSR